MRCSAAWSAPGRAGDRVVAQPPPERLVHQRGDVVGEAEQHGVGGERGDLAVEAAVGVVQPAHRRLGLGGVHGVEQALGLGVAAARAARRARRRRARASGAPRAGRTARRRARSARRRPRAGRARRQRRTSRSPAASRGPRAAASEPIASRTEARPTRAAARARARRAAAPRGQPPGAHVGRELSAIRS